MCHVVSIQLSSIFLRSTSTSFHTSHNQAFTRESSINRKILAFFFFLERNDSLVWEQPFTYYSSPLNSLEHLCSSSLHVWTISTLPLSFCPPQKLLPPCLEYPFLNIISPGMPINPSQYPHSTTFIFWCASSWLANSLRPRQHNWSDNHLIQLIFKPSRLILFTRDTGCEPPFNPLRFNTMCNIIAISPFPWIVDPRYLKLSILGWLLYQSSLPHMPRELLSRNCTLSTLV